MTKTSKTIKLFGIPNCGSVKKAKEWLDRQGASVSFHDFKKQGVDGETLSRWLAQHDWQVILNRRGTTWRRLVATEQAAVTDAGSASELMREKPSLIKRPVIEWPSGIITVGFDEHVLAQAIKA